MRKPVVRAASIACVALLASMVSCGGDDDAGSDGSGGSGNSGGMLSTGGTSSGGTSSGGSSSGGTSSGSCTPPADDTGCVGASFEGETIPLDIYVMFDLSCSMSCDANRSGCCRNSDDPVPEADWRIQPVREAMKAFLEDPLSAGIGVGLGFFGDHDVNDNTDPEVCSLDEHTDAAVEIQRLPDAAPELIAELEAGEPQGGTPTHLAIDGSCVYVENWKEQNPSHAVVILLVTDGIPEHSCNATIELATEAAENCYDGGLGFQTYVLGVVANNNNSLEQLHEIAEAGGTDQAYLTDADDVAGSVLEALNAIRADATIPCDLQIPEPPDGETLNTSRINIGICDSAGDTVVTPNVPSADDCNGEPGWYYDDPNSPETIHLCEVTCETVSVAGAQLFYSIGCETITDVR